MIKNLSGLVHQRQEQEKENENSSKMGAQLKGNLILCTEALLFWTSQPRVEKQKYIIADGDIYFRVSLFQVWPGALLHGYLLGAY